MLEKTGMLAIIQSMDAKHLSLNRPVHLARRDVYYEQAVDLLYEPETKRELNELVQRYDRILFMLKTTRQHAKSASRVNGTDDTDQEFLSFIKLLIGNVRAILTILNQQQSLRRESSFIGSVPKVDELAADCEQSTKDILDGVHNMLNLAGNPFTKLKKANLKSMEKADRTRYNKARKHFMALVSTDEGVSLDDTGHGIAVEDA